MSTAEDAVAIPDVPADVTMDIPADVPMDVPAAADHDHKQNLEPHVSPEGRLRSARERKTVEVYKPEAPKVQDHTIHQVN